MLAQYTLRMCKGILRLFPNLSVQTIDLNRPKCLFHCIVHTTHACATCSELPADMYKYHATHSLPVKAKLRPHIANLSCRISWHLVSLLDPDPLVRITLARIRLSRLPPSIEQSFEFRLFESFVKKKYIYI